MRSISHGERFSILAPSGKKAEIIMGAIIDHTFDDRMFLDQLELDPGEKLDRLRRERSRDNVTFRGGGGVKTLTLDARNGKRNIEAAMGFGGKRIILDESSLISDPLYATVKRMLGGYAHNYSDTFLFEIGNPFYRNHFYRTWHSPRYYKLFIDYKTALAEGRYSEEFIEEVRQEAFFDIFYECLFPPEDVIDERGYRTLVTSEELEAAIIDQYSEPKVWNAEIEKNVYPDGKLRLGVDVGGGGDYNVYYLRNDKTAWVESKNRSNDTMTNVTEVIRILNEHTENLIPQNVYIDDIGVGRGVADRLKEMGYAVNGVSVGEKPITEQAQNKYKNKKAEAYWMSKVWIANGGKIVSNVGLQQIPWIKYKTSTDKVMQIEPKIDLVKRSGKSPDYAEAFMLTFTVPPPEPNIRFL